MALGCFKLYRTVGWKTDILPNNLPVIKISFTVVRQLYYSVINTH